MSPTLTPGSTRPSLAMPIANEAATAARRARSSVPDNPSTKPRAPGRSRGRESLRALAIELNSFLRARRAGERAVGNRPSNDAREARNVAGL